MFNLRTRKNPAVRTVGPSLRTMFTDAEIASMAGLGSIEHIEAGADLMVEGTEGTHAYFIVNGSAAVRRGDTFVAMLGEGDLVGERALITHQPRNATVTAFMPVTALAFNREQFGWLRLESPKVKELCAQYLESRAVN